MGRALDTRVTKATVTKLASEDEEEDWSDVSELEEIDSRQFQSSKDQNGNVENRNFGKGKLCSAYFIKPLMLYAVSFSVNTS